MNVCFKRIKKIAEVSLSERTRKWKIYFAFSLTFLCVNFIAINKECFKKKSFLKNFSTFTGKHLHCIFFCIKLQAFSLQDSKAGNFL